MADEDEKKKREDEDREDEDTSADDAEASEESDESSDDAGSDDASSDDAGSDDAGSDDAGSADEEEEEEDEPPPPPKKKLKKKDGKKAKGRDADEPASPKKKAAASASSKRAPEKAAEPEGEDNSTMLALGAFVLAIVAVGALWWWKSQSSEEEETGDEITTVEGDEPPVEDVPPMVEPPPPEAPGTIPAPPDVAEIPANATRTESGLASRVIQEGSGDARPAPTDRVTVHYAGWTTDGRMFDSSHRRGEPVTFALNQVIRGWTEGVQLMVVGEKRRLWIPQELAYGGRPGMPQGMLVFDIELMSFDTPPPPPPTPEDVAAIPANATTTESGLAFRVLQAGTGTDHPTATSAVRVHYTGWTTDGEMFDSSVTRGEPATLLLNRVIPGWTEGVPLMVVGEKRRLWIPESLAYGGRPGAPPGMLVFDIELVEIMQMPSMPGMPPGHP